MKKKHYKSKVQTLKRLSKIYSKSIPNSDHNVRSFFFDFETKSISSKFPAKYVLEISAGLSEKLNIENGMKINYIRS